MLNLPANVASNPDAPLPAPRVAFDFRRFVCARFSIIHVYGMKVLVLLNPLFSQTICPACEVNFEIDYHQLH